MATEQAALEKLAKLTEECADLIGFWRAATEVLALTVPHYWTPCWYTLDPASHLITSHFHEGMDEFPAEWLAHEYYGDDVNKLVDVVRTAQGVSTLHEATGGEPSLSPRWHQNMRLGGDQELILGLRTRSGEVWGALGLYREPDRPIFSDTEKNFLRAAAPHLARGAQRALLLAEAVDPDTPDPPGLLILNTKWQVESFTPGVEQWLSELPGGDWRTGRPPPALMAVAGRALRSAERAGEVQDVAASRVLSRSGNWIMIHGTGIGTEADRRIAIIIEPAHPARIYPLLMAAYGLTERERDVTRLVLQGYSTSEIAESLVVSLHTVQQHLKSIFEKTGVRSRRDLVGKVFFAHYEPRFRDNERRVAQQRPVHGGPM